MNRAVEPRVMRAIDELVANGDAGRGGLEVGRLLVQCQRCEHFTGAGCRRRADWLHLLTNGRRWCRRWK